MGNEKSESSPSESRGATGATQNSRSEKDSDPQLGLSDVFETIRLVLLSFSVLFGVLLVVIGFFGWRTLGDMDRTVETTVDRRIGTWVSEKSDETSEFTRQLSDLRTSFQAVSQDIDELRGGVLSASAALQLIRNGQTDPVGDYLRLAVELELGAVTVLDADARKRAEIVFRKLLGVNETLAGAPPAGGVGNSVKMPADVLFNAAGTASEFQMPSIAYLLAETAFENHATSENQARMLRTKISAGEISIDDGLREVFQLVETLDSSHQIHLTLSEAYNVSLEAGRLEELTEALGVLDRKLGESAPSYIPLLQAQCQLLTGSETDVGRAIASLSSGLARASRESPRALWFKSSLEAAKKSLDSLASHPTYSREAGEMRSEFEELLSIKSAEPFSRSSNDSENLGLLALQQLFQSSTPAPPAGEHPEIQLGVSLALPAAGWNWYRYVSEADQMLSVTAESVLGQDPRVLIWDAQGHLVAEDDDGGEGLNARVEFSAQSQTIYIIGVGPADDADVSGVVLLLRQAPL